ncbi:unnamed protein product (macronuclear) [Paramecium tetraurelia]|uniref:Protein kinase domain-containing protein n=1 Tax=Paramecium tetraurelia TaxID=5888 RepID=A0E458_PARTE|nr:uncharacterized protein GSPATT00023249001 [Paramecium tetraurelia]CAK90075.1 unnamed protein product [Paramecium tetraurelia]|eukprot:XP_001457472.1 hypothetical protein (macronuclear) [Paramecium tetraurelia strain d4-2]
MSNQKEFIKKQIGEYIFEFSQEIGSGYSSKVYKGQHIKTNQVVAIKVISSQTYTSPIQKSLLKNEIAILLRIDHPHLLRVYEISQSANNTYIVSELCNEGSLEQQMKKTELTTEKVLSILLQVSKGILALHEKKIIHRDIKPANILIKDGIYKLADFGFALIEDQIESVIKRFNVGTPMYMAPEISQTNQYSDSSDIWALGIMLYEMLFNCIPPYKQDIKTFHEDILKKCQKQDFKYQSLIKTLLFGMLQINPQDRLNITQIIQMLKQDQCQSDTKSPRVQSPLQKLNYQFVQSSLNSPLSTSKPQTLDSQRQKYQKHVQSHNKALTYDQKKFDSMKIFSKTDCKVNSVSDFATQEDLPKMSLKTSNENQEQIGQISTECSFSTQGVMQQQQRQKFQPLLTQLPAIILPTFNFCWFLENVIKNMNMQNEQKQKCNFLFRKLLAIKAKAFYSFAPKQYKDQLNVWINQLNSYYEKVQHVLNFTMDNTFLIFFNTQLEDQGKLLSMYLVSLMSQIILKESNTDYEVLIDILQENLKHQNDPFLFARKWAHNQQK